MSQITTTTQPGDIVIVVPGWIMRLVGFMGLFGGLTLSLLIILIGYPIEGFLVLLFTLVWTPIWMLFHYIVWRFYWYLLAAWLSIQAFLWVAGFLLLIRGVTLLPRSLGLDAVSTSAMNANPINGCFSLIIAALITAVVYRLYILSRERSIRPAERHTSSYAPAAQSDDLFSEDAPLPQIDNSLMGRVVRKLEQAGRKTEIKGDTIQVYKGGRLVGIVRVIDRSGSISPLLVNDVAKQRDRIGVKTAYLATSGTFSSDVRSLAGQLGIQLMTV